MQFLGYIIVLLVATFGGCARQPKSGGVLPEIEGVYRAARSIQASLAVGVSYQEFGTSVRDLSKQILLVQDRIRFGRPGGIDPLVVKLTGKYQQLLDMYRDSATAWGLEVQDRPYAPELEELIRKYGTTPIKTDALGVQRKFAFEQLRQVIWERASKLHETMLADVHGVPR